MKSITIHNVDDPLDRLLQERAKSQGMSLNKTIKFLLAESLGITSFFDAGSGFFKRAALRTQETPPSENTSTCM